MSSVRADAARDGLDAYCDQVLIDNLPLRLKEAMARLLRRGLQARSILELVSAQARAEAARVGDPWRAEIFITAVEAWLEQQEAR